MNELKQGLFERRLASLASGFDYPRTPDIAHGVMTRLRHKTRPRLFFRKLAWSLVILLILCSSLMLIPPARAAILEFIQIGAVRIFGTQPTPLPAPIEEVPSTILPMTATPGPTLQALGPALENIAGETKLANAEQIADYPILLPAYPPELGRPDHVYVQYAEGAMTILVWVDPLHRENAVMSLHFIPTGSWAISKIEPQVIQETRVNGQRAIWAVGPYPLILRTNDIQVTRLIDGHVLIWAEGDITYRLETDLDLEEAIKVAESLEPIR